MSLIINVILLTEITLSSKETSVFPRHMAGVLGGDWRDQVGDI